uniref:Reverse transcriptase domain-containing protein n=1 Tax=Timema tahoe TaxID=61484 RepID=A0A7R9IE23_9NEOP|nr:unnamed protein product [Timema tahoe]
MGVVWPNAVLPLYSVLPGFQYRLAVADPTQTTSPSLPGWFGVSSRPFNGQRPDNSSPVSLLGQLKARDLITPIQCLTLLVQLKARDLITPIQCLTLLGQLMVRDPITPVRFEGLRPGNSSSVFNPSARPVEGQRPDNSSSVSHSSRPVEGLRPGNSSSVSHSSRPVEGLRPVGIDVVFQFSSSEFEQRVTRAKKILSADDSLARMKQEMERQIEDQPFFKNIEESLERISSSPEYKSYEQIFKELGGSELQESQDPQSQDQQDKLENLVEDLVKTSAWSAVYRAEAYKGALTHPLIYSNTKLRDGLALKFADDTAILAQSPDARVVWVKLTFALRGLLAYLHTQSLAIQSQKTQAILFTRQPLRVEGAAVQWSQTVRWLGVTLDEKCSWDPHLRSTVGRARGVMVKLAFAPGQYRYNHLRSVYHRFLRSILGAPPRIPNRVLLTMSGLPSLDRRIPRSGGTIFQSGAGQLQPDRPGHRRLRHPCPSLPLNKGRRNEPLCRRRQVTEESKRMIRDRPF